LRGADCRFEPKALERPKGRLADLIIESRKRALIKRAGDAGDFGGTL